MSNMIRKMQRANGARGAITGKSEGSRFKGKRAGFSLRSNPDFNQYSLASALMVFAGMAAMKLKHKPQKAA